MRLAAPVGERGRQGKTSSDNAQRGTDVGALSLPEEREVRRVDCRIERLRPGEAM